MRDLMILAGMVFFMTFALRSGFMAFLLWGWTAVIALPDYIFGFMKGVSFNMIFALISMWLITIGADRENAKFTLSRTALLFVVFAFHGGVCAVLAYEGNLRNWELYTNLLKALAFCLFMPIVLTRRYRIHAMIVALVLGLTFHGLLEGLKTIVTAGGHHVRGISKFGDNNHLAVALVMSVPFLVYLYQYSAVKLVRLVSVAVLALTVAAVIGTQSRGGMLSLLAVGAWIILTGRRKLVAMFALIVAITIVAAAAPSSWWDRMGTIKSAKEDSSFMGRVIAWKVSSAVALERPLIGGGFHAIQNQAVWDQFRNSSGMLGFVDTPDPPRNFMAAHSIYFEVLGDLGVLGLVLFMAILANAFYLRYEIKRLVARGKGNTDWARDLADMTAAATFAYLIGAAALSLAYFEVMYILVMLLEVLKRVVITEQASSNE